MHTSLRRRQTLAGFGALTAWAIAARAGAASLGPPVAGVDYLPLPKLAPVEAPADKIEVVDFFRYDCPHCNAFEPSFLQWMRSAPADVHIRRVPVAFEPSQAGVQLLYYALQSLDLLETLHAKVFQSIHGDHQTLQTLDQILSWGRSQGVDSSALKQALTSFSVASSARKAQLLMDTYKVAGVPALGVAGRFYTDGQLAGTNEKALLVASFLVGQVRRGR